MDSIKSIAVNIMDKEVLKYLRFNTYSAQRHFFICIFDESGDFGINIMDGPLEQALLFLRTVNTGSFYKKNGLRR